MNNKFVGIEKLSLVDYEGKLACTLFTSGCNFRCVFCHNSSLALNNNNNIIEDDEIFDYLSKRKKQLDAVVITGGEPTLMQGLEQKLLKIKQLGYLIKLDTNGTNPDIIKKLVNNKLIDYIAMDIKIGFSKYNLITDVKVNIEKVKESIEYIMNSGIDYEFRTTLVNEYHTLDDIKEMSLQLKGAKKLYLQCFIDNGNCIKNNLTKVNKEDALIYKQYLEQYIDIVKLRNYE